MVRRGEVLAVVQAGGQGSRMDVLTRERAKPVLPYGGVHRLIDFTLSSLVHAGIDDVWVSVQYQVASIDDYLSGGRPWSLDRNRGGFRRMVPQTGTGPATEQGFAYGNADLLMRLKGQIEHFGADTLLVASADHVFNADLRPVVEEHVSSGRVATLLVSEVTKQEARDNVVLEVGARGEVTGLSVKPSRPGSGTVATELFVYRTAALLDALDDLRGELTATADGDDSGLGDFGEHLLPRLVENGSVRAVPLPGYWRDLGRPTAYLQGHRDLLAGRTDVFDHRLRPVISHWPDLPAARVGSRAVVSDSLLSPGCVVDGEVRGSVLGPGVVVGRGARVTDSVLFEGVHVEAGAEVTTSVVDEGCVVEARARVGEATARRVARDEDLVLIGKGSRVGRGDSLPAGSRLEPGSTT